MWGFASVVVVCGSLVYLVRLLRPDVLNVVIQALHRELKTAPPPQAAIVIPTDLLALAYQESESWAKQSAMQSMLEMYELTKDWNVVRANWKPYVAEEMS